MLTSLSAAGLSQNPRRISTSSKNHPSPDTKQNKNRMAPTTVTVLYPSTSTFDMTYYKSTHMPLVQKSWGQYGLQSWRIIQLAPGAPYSVQAILEFSSAEDLQKAQASPEAKDVMEDIPKFSSEKPVFLGGEVAFTKADV
jgi:uncharacterized protein (TIGR02118 family)